MVKEVTLSGTCAWVRMHGVSMSVLWKEPLANSGPLLKWLYCMLHVRSVCGWNDALQYSLSYFGMYVYMQLYIYFRLCYNSDKLPLTEDQWNNFVFIDKTHWGYYCWPKYGALYNIMYVEYYLHVMCLFLPRTLLSYNCVDIAKQPEPLTEVRRWIAHKCNDDNFYAIQFLGWNGYL